jgi:flagellar hook assembly protein FlgD
LTYAIPARRRITLAVYDATGRRVRDLFTGVRAAGEYTTTWDGRDGVGRSVASGVYFVRALTATGATTRKIVLIR